MPPPTMTTRAWPGRLAALTRASSRLRAPRRGAVHARATVGGVGAQHAAGALRIARGDGPDDRLVLGVGDREPAAVLQAAQPEQQQLLGEAAVGLRQARVADEVDQRLVEV